MNANSIGIAPAITLPEGIQGLDEAVASAALARLGRSRDAAPSLSPALRAPECRAGDRWETLSYVVIWLCGLIGVALCFL